MIVVRIWRLIFILLILTFALNIKAANFNKSRSGSELYELETQTDVDQLVTKSQGKPAPGPWHFNNLYDKSSKGFFIPYHLWSGAEWDGNKSTDNCVHEVESIWEFTDAKKRQRKSKILGQRRYTNPKTGETFETYEWRNKRGSQHLICHEKGLARVYDFRFERAGLLDSPVLNGTECKFPAGFGWRIGVPEDCNPKAPKQTTLTKVTFDEDFNLVKIAYTYTEKPGFSAKAADDYYEYVVGKGRVLHSKLP